MASSARPALAVAPRAAAIVGRSTEERVERGRSRNTGSSSSSRVRVVLPTGARRASSRLRAFADDGTYIGGDPEPVENVGLGLTDAEIAAVLASADENVLTTALSRSIAVEDYAFAAKLSARLKELQGTADEPAGEILDWRALGMMEWVADRAESLGFRYPTAVQRRASIAFRKKKDVVIQAQTGSGKTLAYLLPAIDNMDFTARRMLQILVVVPSRELTIQTVMLAFRMFGGNVNVGVPGDPGNILNYKGPKGISAVGVFEESHAEMEGFADVAEIVVGTPELLCRMKLSGKLEVDLASTIIVDEADQLFEQYPGEMAALLKPSPYPLVMEDRQVVLCGVNVPQEVISTCKQKALMKTKPLVVSMGNPGRVPSSVSHRRLVVPRMRKLVALARQIRRDVRTAGEDAPPPRTIVFVPSAEAAMAAAKPLRKSLWGKHKLAVLLPDGKEAIRVMQDFKNQLTTILLCTPEVERGLDMPGVDFVYSLDAPSSTASYLHRAGRCGRIGSTTNGVVTTVCTSEEEYVVDQIMLDLEIANWETLEEEKNAPSVDKAAAAAAAQMARDDDGDGDGEEGGYGDEGDGAIAEEERALTADALNDLFYLVDARAEGVNMLEDLFNAPDASKEESYDVGEDPEEEAESERLRAKMDDIKKLFSADIDDEDIGYGRATEDAAPAASAEDERGASSWGRVAEDESGDGECESVVGEVMPVWEAHKSPDGYTYYYNTVTGNTTWDKPAGFDEDKPTGFGEW